MKTLIEKILDIIDKWDTTKDHKGAICAALYVSDRELTEAEKQQGIQLNSELYS